MPSPSSLSCKGGVVATKGAAAAQRTRASPQRPVAPDRSLSSGTRVRRNAEKNNTRGQPRRTFQAMLGRSSPGTPQRFTGDCTVGSAMPDVEANQRQWDGDYAWPQGGDEWSAGWGGPDAQWHFTLRPRLRRFLPASTILEIAPGYGRWTTYLLESCERYVGVDLSAQSVEACRRRF